MDFEIWASVRQDGPGEFVATAAALELPHMFATDIRRAKRVDYADAQEALDYLVVQLTQGLEGRGDRVAAVRTYPVDLQLLRQSTGQPQ